MRENSTETLYQESLKWTRRAVEYLKDLANLQEDYEDLLQKHNKALKALNDIRSIFRECHDCCVEPPAMKFKCPECREIMMSRAKEVLKNYENIGSLD